jgi:pyridoxal phosphate enzyme (YggS family)
LPEIAERYRRLRAEVPPGVTVVAVAKLQPIEAVAEAVRAGATDVAENYAQEAVRKYSGPEARALRDRFRLHFTGHVQTNKAKSIAATFDMVQSVDRVEAAEALAKAADALGKRLAVLLQINISPAERFGCAPESAPALARAIRAMPSLTLEGVMAIGPLGDAPALARAFQRAVRVWEGVRGPVLSLGMSGDWREAVAAGSTMIRIGTAIFGPRPARPASKRENNHLQRLRSL